MTASSDNSDLKSAEPLSGLAAFVRGVENGPGKVPNLRGLSLREATAALAAQGYHARVCGNGVVVAQHPAQGQALAPGGTCHLRLADAPAGATSLRAVSRGAQ